MNQNPSSKATISEFGEPLTAELEQRLKAELDSVQGQIFPEDHPYDEALRRTLKAKVLTLNCEKIIARHCFHICAEIIRTQGDAGRQNPDYQKYIELLRSLPTDWFDDANGELLDQVDMWN
jgi:hypothetical protein